MTIYITQKCNGCFASRELEISLIQKTTSRTLDEVAREGGWRPVPEKPNEHLCAGCVALIVEAVNKRVEEIGLSLHQSKQ